MCGFSGCFSINKKNNFTNISQYHSLKHRGPDASAIIDFGPNNTFNRFDFSPKNLNSKSPLLDSKKKIVIGHNRLSILGLGKIGDQPMVFNDRYVLSFNGEIYNYKKLRGDFLQGGGSGRERNPGFEPERLSHANDPRRFGEYLPGCS